MNRALSNKAAVALLKNEFSARGVALAHLEALNIVARLQGFNAWSHLAAANTRESLPMATASEVRLPTPGSQVCVLAAPEEATLPPVSRDQYELEQSQVGCLDEWLTTQINAATALDSGVLPADVRVLDATGAKVGWSIQHNLTDRWGELNTYNLEDKPALSQLISKAGAVMLKYLRSRMVTEVSFVAYKDEEFGLLHEVEYCTVEADGATSEAGHAFPQEALLLPSLVRCVQTLAPQYPQLQLAVLPGGSNLTREGRPAVWAWVPWHVLMRMTDNELEQLARHIDQCDKPTGAVSPWGHG